MPTEPVSGFLALDVYAASGFGILLTNQLVDDLVYNERRNELMFVKYL